MPAENPSQDLPCSNCGAGLVFAPGAGSLECAHCGTMNELPAGDAGPWAPVQPIREHDYLAAIEDRLPAAQTEESATLPCPGCGAEIGFDADTLAEDCPFCATPLAKADSHPHRHPKADGVLPFLLTERDAKARLTAWFGRLWFAPSGLKRYAEAGRPMQGVYLPFYTYDARGRASYRGQRGDAYYVSQTVTVMREGKPTRVTRRVRKIRWSAVSGRVSRHFDDILVPASTSIEPAADRAEAGLQSWDLAALEPFRREFLAGFRAEAPSVGLEPGFARAAQLMERALARDAKFQIGGDAQRLTHLEARYSEITFKHVLLPLWIAAYRWRNKPFRVVINGRTGEVTGARPWSTLKIALAVLCVLAAGMAIALVMGRP